MIWIKRIGVALFLAVALTLLPLLLSFNSLNFLHWPMLIFERTFKASIPLNAGKRVITLFLANMGAWAVLVLLLEASWYALKRTRLMSVFYRPLW